MVDDLLAAIEQYRIEGFVSKYLNSTFLTLIPKGDKHVTFVYFRPISLCNLIYKVISKVIANCIKPKLAEVLSKEQFDFLGKH